MGQWFVETSSQIEGPYSTDMVKNRLLAGHLSHEDKIWGRMLEEWRSIQWWMQALPEISKQEVENANPEVWHYAFNGATYGPLAWGDFVNNLKGVRASSMTDLMQIMVWTKGMKEWAPILEFHDIMSSLGVNKREIPRADISGRVVIHSMGNSYISSLQNIGEGGFGCDPIPGLVSGESVSVEIQSEVFKISLHAKANVRYVTERLAGFKFSQLSVESKSLIVQYVRRASGTQKFLARAG